MWIEVTYNDSGSKSMINLNYVTVMEPLEDGGTRIFFQGEEEGIDLNDAYVALKNELLPVNK